MAQPTDLQHVLDILEGRVPPAPSSTGLPARSHSRVQQQRGGRSERGMRGRSWPPTPQSHGPRTVLRNRETGPLGKPVGPRRQVEDSADLRSSGGSSGAPAAPTQPPQPSSNSASYNEPSQQSTSGVLHCAACDVWVPKRTGDWETHVRGIRHQRQLLSLKVHGERGKLVLSAFESMPGPSNPSYRLVGKGAAQFDLAAGPSSLVGPLPSLPAQQQQAVKRLRTLVLAQLLNLFGVGATYNAAAQELSEQRLAAAVSSRRASKTPASDEQASTLGNGLLLRNAAMVAAASHTVQREGYPATHAHLQVDLEGQPFAGVAACFAALRLLLDALGSAPTPARLTLSLRCSAMQSMPGYQLLQLGRAWGAHVVQGLGTLLERNPAIRSVQLEVPACLAAPSRQHLPALQRAAQAAPAVCRQHLLLALHPRAGRCSLLQLLPLPLVHEVMELAAPLQPCSIEVAAAQEG